MADLNTHIYILTLQINGPSALIKSPSLSGLTIFEKAQENWSGFINIRHYRF